MAQDKNDNDTYELDLAPMLAMMVTLIPILLLSTAFIQIKIIETDLPQAVKQAIKDGRDDDKKPQIFLKASADKGFALTINNRGRIQKRSIPLKEGELDMGGLYEELVTLKQRYPDVFRLGLQPEGGLKYDKIIKIMDEASKIKEEKSKVYFFDKESQKKVATDLMFPDVYFANLLEG